MVQKLYFELFHTCLALFGPLYGLVGQFLTLLDTKTPFLALWGEAFPG